MGNIWSSEVDLILSAGRSLESLGVKNWALERQAALIALKQLAAIGVGVLGGDVYIPSGQGMQVCYDNWYCNREAGESESDFVIRSIAKAKSYIENYKAPAGSVFFAIVPSLWDIGKIRRVPS